VARFLGGRSDITVEEFNSKMAIYKKNLERLFDESQTIEKEIRKQIARLKYE